ncbi:MAG: hypothetical protein AB8I08_12285 [Sandaracinaceae bacterium]
MRLYLCLLAGALGACGSPTPASRPPAEQTSTEVPPTPTTNAPDPSYYSDAELVSEGFSVEPEDAFPTRQMFGPDGPSPTVEGYDFLCRGEESSRTCVCRRPLPCTAEGDCITYERNIAVFREALADPAVNVICEHAEIGRCGDWRYFYFQGGIHRYEMRLYDAEGALVAQSNSTDYNEYCNHTAGVQWMGRVPKCDRLVREELICGEAERALRAPLADLLGYTGRGL